MELYDYHWILHRGCRLYRPHPHHRHHFVHGLQLMYMIINGFYIVVVAFIGPTAQVFGWSLCFIFVLSFVFRSFEVCIPIL